MKFMKAPSVKDYERMTQRARLSAANFIAAQIEEVERRRTAMTPVLAVRHELTPDETQEAARFLLVRYQRLYQDPPSTKAQRLIDATAEADGLWASQSDGKRQRGGYRKAS